MARHGAQPGRRARGCVRALVASVMLLSFAFVACREAIRPSPPVDASAQPSPLDAPSSLRLPTAVRPLRYDLRLDVDPARPSTHGDVSIALEIAAPTEEIVLHADGLRITRATLTLEGRQLPIAAIVEDEDRVRLTLSRPAAVGEARLELAFRGRAPADASQGLFRRQVGDDWYMFTSFQPVAARRAVPCWDEPAYKTPWAVTLVVPTGQAAVSNMPIQSVTRGADGTDVVRFEQTPPLSSYLVALAVGPFEAVDAGQGGRGHAPVRILVPRGRSAEASHAASVTGELITRVEAFLDRPFPFSKLDVVAIPGGIGAMENPGLVTFDAAVLLANPATQPAEHRLQYVTGMTHEIAHHWFGDQVTMAWWDDLWLNESLASWTERQVTSRGGTSSSRVWSIVARSEALHGDAQATPRRLRAPMETRAALETVLDAVVYRKGEAVLTMFAQWMGPRAFMGGVQHFLDAHAWKTATSRDLLDSLATAGGRPELARSMEGFLDLPGAPLVSVQLRCGAGPPTAELRQERLGAADSPPPADHAWRFPICVRYPSSATSTTSCTMLAEEATEVVLTEADGCPAWLTASAGGTGYYRVRYESELLRRLLSGGTHGLTTEELVSMLGDLRALVELGRIDVSDLLEGVRAMLATTDDPLLVQQAIRALEGLRDDLVPSESRDAYAHFLRATFAARLDVLSWNYGADPERDALWAALLALLADEGRDERVGAHAVELARRWLDDRSAISPDLAPIVLPVAARRGDRALVRRIDEQARRTSSEAERAILVSALGSFRGDEGRLALELVFDGPYTPRERLLDYGVAVIRDPEVARVVHDALTEDYERIVEGLPPSPVPFISAIWSFVERPSAIGCTPELRESTAATLSVHAGQATAAAQLLDQVLAEIDRCIAFRRRQQPSLVRFLGGLPPSPRPSTPAAGGADLSHR
ncbi:MAG: M1 family metallopeptidase [Myxococcales bacterium]|nr:M1 family metallopeptidase [Myxococcales bacterium]